MGCAVKCLKVSLTDDAWEQASLPLRYGGLGLRGVADLALPCYLASVHSSLDLTQQIFSPTGATVVPECLRLAVTAFREAHPNVEPPDAEQAKIQKSWDGIACDARFTDLLATADQIQRARLLPILQQPHRQLRHFVEWKFPQKPSQA